MADWIELLEKHTLQEVADIVGVSRQAIHQRVQRYKINYKKKGKSNIPPKEVLLTLSDLPYREIGKIFNVCSMTVSYWYKSYGIKKPRGKQAQWPQKISKEQLIADAKNMISKDIAKKYGVSLAWVCKLKARYSLTKKYNRKCSNLHTKNQI